MTVKSNRARPFELGLTAGQWKVSITARTSLLLLVGVSVTRAFSFFTVILWHFFFISVVILFKSRLHSFLFVLVGFVNVLFYFFHVFSILCLSSSHIFFVSPAFLVPSFKTVMICFRQKLILKQNLGIRRIPKMSNPAFGLDFIKSPSNCKTF